MGLPFLPTPRQVTCDELEAILAAPPPPSAVPREAEDKALQGAQKLRVADLSGTCRRESFCLSCAHAFCNHCCWHHHVPALHLVIPVDVDSAGQAVFTRRDSQGYRMYTSDIEDMISENDYAARLPWDSFCLLCQRVFAAAACPDHHRQHHGENFPDHAAVLPIEERGGRHCVRCTGSEWWFTYLERILDDPVEEDEEYELLPVLTTRPNTCKQCGGPHYGTPAMACSSSCSASYERDLAGRRQRREARQAARLPDGQQAPQKLTYYW